MSLYDDASLIMYPSGYKEDKIYSLKPTDGSGDLTFTRASSATRVNAEGLIEEVPVNKFKYSEQFDNAVYSLTSSSITANAINSPIGTLTADKLVENTENNLHRVGQGAIAVTSGQVYTFSFYAKAAERNELELQRINTSGTVFNSINVTTADLTNGTLSVGSNVTASNIESVGDGWYRISISLTAIATGSGGLNIGMQKDGNVLYAGDGFSGVYLWGFQMNSGSTAKPYFPTTDRLNVPRLDYSGGASCASLLLEPQRSNLITYSESFDNAFWDKIRGNITSNALISPDGTLSADLFTSIDNATAYVQNNASITVSGSKQSISLFVKKGSTNWCYLLLWDGTANGCYQYFDIENGVSGDEDTFGSGVTVDTTNIETYPNDWYRISVTYNCSIANLKARISQTNGNSDVLSDTGATIYIWGFQVESNSSYPTSYIPSNSGSQTTRIADACYGAGDASTFNDSEGVLMVEAKVLDFSTSNSWISISQEANVNNNQFNLRFVASSNLIQAVSRAGGLGQDVVLQYTLSDKTIINKIAIKYKLNDWALWVNGVEVDTETSSNAFTPNSLDVLDFHRGNNSNYFYGKTKQLQVYNTALTDSELETLTSWTSFSEMANAQQYKTY